MNRTLPKESPLFLNVVGCFLFRSSFHLSGHEKLSMLVMLLAEAFHCLLFRSDVVCFGVIVVVLSSKIFESELGGIWSGLLCLLMKRAWARGRREDILRHFGCSCGENGRY